ncbi:MAG TPA: transglycosylase domain-containing protein [Cyclobacteriaceae bacterium]|nr:transglycosylase domain-containing protein [Cyclobacteriaceae bacterium]
MKRKVTLLLLGSVAAVAAFFVFLYLLVVSGATGPIPSREELARTENPTASEVYSADSVLLGRYFIQERSNVAFEDLPKSVVDGLVATEDVRFYKHNGIDIRSLGRVIVKTMLLQNESAGGGSTITQQLAKNLFPRKKYTFLSLPINKIREMVIASRIEKVYDKKTIITLYLNTVPFGENIFGIEGAAQRFFSVPVRNLQPELSAVLVGMLKATYSYNPRLFPEPSKNRRNVVISQMEKYGMITEMDKESWTTRPLELKYNKITHHAGPAPYFREYLRAELEAWLTKYNSENDTTINLYTDGLKIYTTIDSRLQRAAEEAVGLQMANLQKKFNNHWGKQQPWDNNLTVLESAVKRSDRYRALKKSGQSHDEIIEIMKKPLPMTLFTYEGEKEVTMSPMDSIKHYLKFLNTGVLAMDPRNGAIKVWVGGVNHQYFQYDHVKQTTKRQVGSTFKPIVYAAAVEEGVRPCAFISAEKTVYNNMEGWTPKNTDEDNYDLKFSMPGALAYSVNTVSVKVLEKAGMDNTIRLAHNMGIESDLEAVPSMALGTADVSVMEMVSAYSVFAANGNAAKPFYLTSITTNSGEVLQRFEGKKPTRAMSPETAQLMLHMLRRAVNEGTSAALRGQFGLVNDIAGKTGTTQSNTDGWFIGITPKLVVGAWVGGDDPAIRFRTTSLGQGAKTALPIVGEFLKQTKKDKSLDSITYAKFPGLPGALAERIDCDLFKEDRNIFRKLSGRKEKKKDFGEKKEGFIKKLFKKKG